MAKNLQRLSGRDFQNTFQKGRALQGRFLLLKTTNNTGEGVRVGVAVAAKVVKKPARRNYFKRVLRAILKEEEFLFKKGNDIILVLNQKPEEAGFEELKKDAHHLLYKTGLI